MITELSADQLPVARALLREGFPERGERFWELGLTRLHDAALRTNAGLPMGHLLWSQGQAVGVALTPIGLRRDAQGGVLHWVNLSCWYLQSAHRWRLAQLLRHMLGRPNSLFIDLTPTPDVARILQASGFAPANQGVVLEALPTHLLRPAAACLRPWTEALHPAQSWVGPQAVAQALHWGHQAWVLQPEGQASELLVLRPKRLCGLPGMRLMYADSLASLQRHLPVLARALLRQGRCVLEREHRAGVLGYGSSLRGRDVCYVRGEGLGDRVDRLGTECALFELS